MARYSVRIKRSAIREIERVANARDRQRIVELIESLGTEPRPAGCRKLVAARQQFRIRQGSYRVLYQVDDAALDVEVFKVGHRRDVYR